MKVSLYLRSQSVHPRRNHRVFGNYWSALNEEGREKEMNYNAMTIKWVCV